MRIQSAHNINHRFNLISERATSVPEQCTNYCRNAQTECQQNALTPDLCETGSNFLGQYNFCQSCIEDNSTNPDMAKTSLLLRYIRCVGYCKVQEGNTPSVGGGQTGGSATGQDGGLSTTVAAIVTTKGASTSSSLVQAVVTMTASVDKGQKTMVIFTIPGTTKPAAQPTNNPLLPISSTSTPLSLSTPLFSSSSASTSTSPTTLIPFQTLAIPTSSAIGSPTTTSTAHPNSATLPSNSITNRQTAPWVWAIVSITIVVVFLLSCGSFFVFYKRGRSKRSRARQRGMKGMVELKETAMGHGFVDSKYTSRTRLGMGGIEGMAELGDDIGRAELDQGTGIVGVYGLERQRGGMGYGGGGEGGARTGGIIRAGLVLPVELPSVSGCVELPTSFNERDKEEGDAAKEGWKREKC